MITKITGEAAFQVMASNFSISPSQEGYTLQISADGKQYSNLFSVGAGVTRLVTGVAANSYYRLLGNQSQVSVNWLKSCGGEGGGSGSGTELAPVEEFPLGAVDGTVVAYNGTASASGVYQYTGEEWVPVGVDDLSAYWTSAQTKDYVDSAVSAVALDKLVPVSELPASAEPGTVMALISAEWAYWDEPVVDYADSSITYTYHQNANSNKGGTVGTVGFYSLGDHPIITVASHYAGMGFNGVDLTFTSGGTSTTRNMYNGHDGPTAYFSGNCEFSLFRTWSRLFESTCVVENGDCILTIKIYYEFTIQQAGGNQRIYDAIDQPRTLPTYGVYQYDGTTWNEVGADVDLSAYWTSAQTKDYVDSGFWTSAQTKTYVDSAVSGIDLSNYYTKAETDSAITAVEDHIYDVEKVAASALTELHADITEVQEQIDTMDEVVSEALVDLNERIGEISGSSVDLSGYYTSGETDAAISAATAGKADAANVTTYNYRMFPKWNAQGIITGTTGSRVDVKQLKVNGVDNGVVTPDTGSFPSIWSPTTHGNAGEVLVSTGNGAPVWSAMTFPTPDVDKAYVDSAITEVQDQIDTMDDVVSAALVDLNDRKVESASVSTIWKGTQAEYGAIVTKDASTLYIIVNNS